MPDELNFSPLREGDNFVSTLIDARLEWGINFSPLREGDNFVSG